MKQRLTVLVTLLLMINQVLWPQSQNHFVWLRLSDERIIINAQFEQISTDSLIVLRGGRMTGIPLEEIIQIRVIREVSIINGMLIGAGAGIVAGAVIVPLQNLPTRRVGLPPLRRSLLQSWEALLGVL